jgi:hypothetical protein
MKLLPTQLRALHEAAVRKHCACLGVTVDEWRFGRSAWHADITDIIADERITMLIALRARNRRSV